MARILVVDDDKDIIQVIELLVRQDGHKVIRALDGDEGVKMALSSKPDLIILDIMMPEKGGFAVNSLLLADPTTQHIPLIILSALDIERKTLLPKPNIRRYIKKPFDPDMLLDQIRMVLNENKKKKAA